MTERKRLSAHPRRLSNRFVGCVIGLACGAMVVAGCQRGRHNSQTLSTQGVEVRCKTPEQDALDLNADGKNDVRHYSLGGVRVCSQLDLDFDGRSDLIRFYDGSGMQPGEEYYDFDFDGKIDSILHYSNNALIRQELDSNFDSRIDTWLWCGAGGWVQRAERDQSNDGRPDVWESYADGVIAYAEYDEDGDARRDRWEDFRDGKLFEVRLDTNGDGTADTTEPVVDYNLGPKDDAIRCRMADALPEAAVPAEPSSGGDAGRDTKDGPGSEKTDGADDAPATDAAAQP